MKPELEIWIDQAETNWLLELYAYAETLYRNSSLPSHDHTHHLRVWNLCKLLLREIATFNSRIDESLVEGVLIAALFHDLGMARSTSEDHGRLGSELCKQWFRDAGRTSPARMHEILLAIELHDRKEEQIYAPFKPETPPEILGILSVADDLEALGIIGIYRYAEIYLMRGIPLEELGSRVLKNAFSRFEHLSEGCRLCGQLLEKYQKEYDELRHFFNRYNFQLTTTTQANEVYFGPLGVINYIRKPGRDKGEIERADKEVSDYFRKLEHELEQARL